METKTLLWSVAASVVAITISFAGGTAFFFWGKLSLEEKLFLIKFFNEHFIFFFSGAVLLLIGLGLLLDGMMHTYVLPIGKLIEETTLMSSVNPAHRITPDGSPDVKLLAGIINNWGDLFQKLQQNVKQEIQISKAAVEREKNILAAFMAEFREGVLVCNAEGRILLYNKSAVLFFSRQPHERPDKGEGDAPQDHSLWESQEKMIGLGRSIFRIFDKNLIVHALDEIMEKLHQKERNAVSYFVAVSRQETLLRVEMTPVLDSQRQLTGMILVMHDISAQLEKDQRLSMLLQSFIKGLRASSGSLRSAIETVMAYPEMDPAQLDLFRKIIHEESMTLGNLADKVADEYPRQSETQWPLVAMRAKDLIDMVRRKAKDRLGVLLDIEESVETHWVKVDSYSMILAILFLVNRLKGRTGSEVFAVRMVTQGRFTAVDLIWSGEPIRIETLRQWGARPLVVGDQGLPLTLKEVVGHHEAEIWSYASPTMPGSSYLRLFLPATGRVEEPDTVRQITLLTEESRPVFYDFDLFNQAHLPSEMGDRLLTELAYTVFDTETTGLDPRGGDEIISIGAVRAINGRLLPEEQFDQLIDPQRQVSHESMRIHGIRPEMLKGQPTIAKVLPVFHRFCEHTVLVAHNAAFDILMLKIKEAVTGVKFTHPVLDTLLLSDALHPAHNSHDLEAIAQRLGIRLVGRHTALGDALTTAEILLKMIPLLANKGVFTLKDALSISRRSKYTRLRY